MQSFLQAGQFQISSVFCFPVIVCDPCYFHAQISIKKVDVGSDYQNCGEDVLFLDINTFETTYLPKFPNFTCKELVVLRDLFGVLCLWRSGF